MSLTTEQYVEAATEALQKAPFRYWVSGYNRVQVRRVAELVMQRFPDSNIISIEYYPPYDQCVIFDGGKQKPHFSDELKSIAQRRDEMNNDGTEEDELPI